MKTPKNTTHALLPSFAFMRNTALVFLRIFFRPSGLRVDKHVLHCGSPGGAVKQAICGRLDDVPVPRKMSSSASSSTTSAFEGDKTLCGSGGGSRTSMQSCGGREVMSAAQVTSQFIALGRTVALASSCLRSLIEGRTHAI